VSLILVAVFLFFSWAFGAAELYQRCCHQKESDSIHCSLFIAFVHSCIIKDFARNDVVSGLVSPQI